MIAPNGFMAEYLTRVTRYELARPVRALGLRRVRVAYSADDPFAVTVAVANRRSWAVWRFARDLLADGLHRGAGLGVVHVCPAPHEPGERVAIILRPAPGIGFELLLRRAEIQHALEGTYRVVPAGAEGARIAWDRELAALNGGEA